MPCDEETLDPNCQVCLGVRSRESICGVCDNSQGRIYQLSGNTCQLRNDTCKYQDDSGALNNFDFSDPTGSICKPCQDVNKLPDMIDLSNPKCSLDVP